MGKQMVNFISYVVGLPNNSYNPITNTVWLRARLCKLQKGALDSQPQVIKFTICLPNVFIWVILSTGSHSECSKILTFGLRRGLGLNIHVTLPKNDFIGCNDCFVPS
jgi:hypothetical protein